MKKSKTKKNVNSSIRDFININIVSKVDWGKGKWGRFEIEQDK